VTSCAPVDPTLQPFRYEPSRLREAALHGHWLGSR
jgi:hypothetical protein